MSETRKIAAILVADVVGYSRLAGADEAGAFSRAFPSLFRVSVRTAPWPAGTAT